MKQERVNSRRGVGTRVLLAGLVSLAAAATFASPALASKTPVPAPVHGVARFQFGRALLFHRTAVTVPRREVLVSGTVSPWRRGQFVFVRVKRGHHFLLQHKVALHYGRDRKGHFSTSFNSATPGDLTVYVMHWKTPQMYRFVSRRKIVVMDGRAGPGSRGQFVRWLQHRLSAMHFYVPHSGVYDYDTGLTIDAFHRLLGWGTYRTLDRRTIKYLFNGWGSFRVRFPGHGRHAEADLSKQLLALINGSHVVAILPISSGKPSTPTILGNYRIYYRDPGYNSEGMYYSDFFIRGYAIHGYNPAPDYPASHGCLRLDISEAIWVYNWLAMGDWVDVYR